jgi:hypothetical protein
LAAGSPFDLRSTLDDQIPARLPTGQVFNGGNNFLVGTGATASPARFIFSTLTGTIEAWSPVSDPLLGNAEIKASVPGAAYTGLALATSSYGQRLYAANFGQGRVDAFDSSFNRVTLPSWAFRDAHLPKGLVPFNVQTLRRDVFVSYDAIDPTSGRELLGVGVGAVDEFTADGRLIKRIATHQSLNAPWGLDRSGELGQPGRFAADRQLRRRPDQRRRAGPVRLRARRAISADQRVRHADLDRRAMVPDTRYGHGWRHRRAVVQRRHRQGAARPARPAQGSVI